MVFFNSSKEKSHDNYVSSWETLKKKSVKERTPPSFDCSRNPYTPQNPGKKHKNSTPESKIHFGYERSYGFEDATKLSLSPISTEYLNPINPNYKKMFPEIGENQGQTETKNFKSDKHVKMKSNDIEEELSDDDNDTSFKENNLSEKQEITNIRDENDSLRNIEETKKNNNDLDWENYSDPNSKSISNTSF